MPFTASQTAKIKQIMAKHEHETRRITGQFRDTVVGVIQKLDTKKTEQIKKQIAKT